MTVVTRCVTRKRTIADETLWNDEPRSEKFGVEFSFGGDYNGLLFDARGRRLIFSRPIRMQNDPIAEAQFAEANSPNITRIVAPRASRRLVRSKRYHERAYSLA